MQPPYPVPPMMPPKSARTFVKRGFYLCCSACGLAVPYCACDRQRAPGVLPEDGPAAAASLNARIADVKR